MRIPDFLFPLINFCMGVLLRSPLHMIMSHSVILVTFTGRRSGKEYTTPVRYVQDGNTIRSFSSPSAQWWRNLQGGADVTITIRGKNMQMRGTLLDVDDDTRMRLFMNYLTQYPGDGAYHGLRVRRNQPLPLDALREVLPHVAIVEFR